VNIIEFVFVIYMQCVYCEQGAAFLKILFEQAVMYTTNLYSATHVTVAVFFVISNTSGHVFKSTF
jgi:hypothetical protein